MSKDVDLEMSVLKSCYKSLLKLDKWAQIRCTQFLHHRFIAQHQNEETVQWAPANTFVGESTPVDGNGDTSVSHEPEGTEPEDVPLPNGSMTLMDEAKVLLEEEVVPSPGNDAGSMP